MRDVIVIGAGLAGLMGALALAQNGRKPFIVAKGQGTTHWTSGTVDIWGDPGDRHLRQAVLDVIQQRPDHPYALTGFDQVEAAVAQFRSLMEAARYPYVGSFERNVLLPTAIGALRPAAFFPATMAAGDARLGGEILIAGFRELRDFFPPMAAANLRAQGIAARGIYLDLPSTINRKLDFSSRSFAELFDQPTFRQEVAQKLRAERGTATRVGLPAVLGLRQPMAVVEELQRIIGLPVFEIPTIPPSIPGLRLFEILRAAIVQAGGRFQIGSQVIRSSADGQTLQVIYSEAAAREQEHRAKAFLLATGGIAGGGIVTNHAGKVHEHALSLPLAAPAGREHWFAPRFLDEHGHPIFQSGVRVSAMMRPVTADGTVVYQNVAVAGAALTGFDPLRERCYSGVSLATGWNAGVILAKS